MSLHADRHYTDPERVGDGYYPFFAPKAMPDLLTSIYNIAVAPGTMRPTLIRMTNHTYTKIRHEARYSAFAGITLPPPMSSIPVEVTDLIPRFPGFEIVRTPQTTVDPP